MAYLNRMLAWLKTLVRKTLGNPECCWCQKRKADLLIQNPLWEANDCPLKRSWFCAVCYNELNHEANQLNVYGRGME